jgi:hypothetical protein
VWAKDFRAEFHLSHLTSTSIISPLRSLNSNTVPFFQPLSLTISWGMVIHKLSVFETVTLFFLVDDWILGIFSPVHMSIHMYEHIYRLIYTQVYRFEVCLNPGHLSPSSWDSRLIGHLNDFVKNTT